MASEETYADSDDEFEADDAGLQGAGSVAAKARSTVIATPGIIEIPDLEQGSKKPGKTKKPVKPRKGAILEDRQPSIRKTNAERDLRIALSAKINLVLAAVLLGNICVIVYHITRPKDASAVYVQYYSHAGLMTPIEPVLRSGLKGPIARRVEPAQEALGTQPEAPATIASSAASAGTLEAASGAGTGTPLTASQAASGGNSASGAAMQTHLRQGADDLRSPSASASAAGLQNAAH